MTDQEKNDIYVEYQPKVYSFVYSKLQNKYDSEDMTADIFVKIFSKLDSFDESKSSLSTWIFTITRNTLYDYYRTNHISAGEVDETFKDDSTSIEDEVCNDESLDQLADALENLPERERDLVLLYYYKGKTLKEIADSMGISYSYVKIIHNNALSLLRKSL